MQGKVLQGSDCSFFLRTQAVQVHKSFLPFTNQNLPVSVSVPLQKLISPDHNKISLPTRISLYLYLFKNRSYPIIVKYLYQPESLSICICTSSKTDSTRSKSNIVRLHKFVWRKSFPLWTSLKLFETCIPEINNTAVDYLSNCESRTNTKDLILTIQSLRCCKYLLCSNIAMYCDTSLFSELKMPFPHFQFCILIIPCYEG